MLQWTYLHLFVCQHQGYALRNRLRPTVSRGRLGLPSQVEGKPNPEDVGKAYGPNTYKCQRYDIDGDVQVLATRQHASRRVP